MRRVLLSAGIGLTLCASMAIPAGASRDDQDPARPAATAVEGTRAAQQPDAVRPTAPPIQTRPDAVSPDAPQTNDVLRLDCNGRTSDAGRTGVACTWSVSDHPAAAGYVLVRSNGDTRGTVFTTRDLRETSTVDSDIRPDVAYTYVVLVVDARGNTVGSSEAVAAGVRTPQPELTVLALNCEAVDAAPGARCGWRATSAADAIGYQLWRIVDRGERELVWRGGLDQTSASDAVPADAKLVRYAVLAVDDDGDVVSQSRPVSLRFNGEHRQPQRPQGLLHRAAGILSYR